MPRKLFRKFLPSHDSIRSNCFVACFGSALQHHNLWHLHRRSVAGGLAVGLFTGMIPGPVQMLCAALLSVILRVNLPVAVAATWFTNPVTIIPVYMVAFKLGSLVTGDAGAPMPDAVLTLGGGITEWIPTLLAWMAAMGKPFAVGLVLLAVILAALGYVAVLAGWRLYVVLAWRRRRRLRESPPT
jgi:uncharacterized protein (DUF2062 family)